MLQTEQRAQKQEILEALREDATLDDAGAEAPVFDDLPAGLHALSEMQQSMWYLESEQPERDVFNLEITLRMHGALDVRALESALHDLLQRHAALRTVIVEHDAAPVQRIASVGETHLEPETVPGGDENALHAMLAAVLEKPFGAMHAPLYRC